MGEVYRARYTKLHRDVALKFLPVQLAADPDRLSRFRREAQILAALNRPDIAQIYGLEEANGAYCIAMELVVEGITVSPGFNYERAPRQDVFLKRSAGKNLFR